ncbi:DUF4230 domain-containing protein [Flavobacteriaceae bacterium F08102]|nr:DUF4230 domain-containing protein [Flavobacteriaceae bacterium F08102]
MKKFGSIFILVLFVFLFFRYCTNKSEERSSFEGAALIQEQIKNVGKLIVTEGHFSEVYNFKNAKDVFANLITSRKKALVVVNAEVLISYDLSKINVEIDQEHKILRIKSIPKEEIKILPELKYYDIQADYFNPFTAEDYNKIQKTVKDLLTEKINQSSLLKNAKARLLSELSKFYVLTSSLGWTLQYNEIPIDSMKKLEAIKP